ncbi:restriction endonuclease subunit S [Halpernia sp.]|uniref:restriction endonuclease subunit S n=1 Tax=Halpernia sp. TaxID=2782209 RepID=UPI003A94BCAF
MEAANYKQTSVGLIPSDWEVKKLGSLGKIISGLTYSPEDVSGDDGILVLRSSNVQERQLVFDDNVFVKVEAFNSVQKNDILICVRNGSKNLIGKNALITQEIEGVAFGAFMAIFRSDFNKYLFQIFGTDLYQKEIHKNLGATINSINGSDLKEFKIPLPPLPEQEKIAKILSTWDSAIDECKTIIENLKLRNKGLSQQLLSGKMRVKGFEETKWNNQNLGHVTENFSRRNKSLIDARIYSVTNSNGFVLQSDHFSREVAGSDLNNYKIIRRNEFAYNPARINVGSIAYFSEDIGVISSLYVCFKTNDLLHDGFLSEWLKLEKTNHDINRYGEGGVRVYLWYDLFKTIKINFPDLKEQYAIVNILEKATEELHHFQQKLEKLQLEKKGLMQQLLTGKVRVKI